MTKKNVCGIHCDLLIVCNGIMVVRLCLHDTDPYYSSIEGEREGGSSYSGVQFCGHRCKLGWRGTLSFFTVSSQSPGEWKRRRRGGGGRSQEKNEKGDQTVGFRGLTKKPCDGRSVKKDIGRSEKKKRVKKKTLPNPQTLPALESFVFLSVVWKVSLLGVQRVVFER